jgi:hypothetical protein
MAEAAQKQKSHIRNWRDSLTKESLSRISSTDAIVIHKVLFNIKREWMVVLIL